MNAMCLLQASWQWFQVQCQSCKSWQAANTVMPSRGCIMPNQLCR